MLIECRAKRAGGTEVSLDGEAYCFLPVDEQDTDSPHVCDVKNPDHVERFLSISEAYNELGKSARSKEQPVVNAGDEPVVEMVEDDDEVDVVMGVVETLSTLSVRQIRSELPKLTDEQLMRLYEIEESNNARTSLLSDIRKEGERREPAVEDAADD